jgi:hypothetical protein
MGGQFAISFYFFISYFFFFFTESYVSLFIAVLKLVSDKTVLFMKHCQIIHVIVYDHESEKREPI